MSGERSFLNLFRDIRTPLDSIRDKLVTLIYFDEAVQCELCEKWLHMSCEGFKTAPRASGSALSADCQTGGSKSAVTPVPIFDLRVGQIVKSSVSFGVPKMPACDKIRPTSVSGSPQVT